MRASSSTKPRAAFTVVRDVETKDESCVTQGKGDPYSPERDVLDRDVEEHILEGWELIAVLFNGKGWAEQNRESRHKVAYGDPLQHAHDTEVVKIDVRERKHPAMGPDALYQQSQQEQLNCSLQNLLEDLPL